MLLFISIAIYLSLSYTFALFLASRRRRPPSLPAPTDLLFVFVLPCLNEELVIKRSLERLLSVAGNFAVLVIDDGSDDATADIVLSAGDERVHLLRRVLPNARDGKGRALNCAYRYLMDSDVLGGRSHDDVVLAVIDADGRVALNALTEVAPYFRDPKVGGVQIGVRMFNARATLLARIQDFEFIAYNEIFQRGRQRLGSVGLGGNGQFTRLSALSSLGSDPWSNFLTEDLDLSIRLLLKGWQNFFCPTTYVSQQALTRIRPLVRQRTRWFQGHLQTWRRIPMVLRSGLPPRTMLDLVNLILQPGLLLAISLVPPAAIAIFVAVLASQPAGLAHALVNHGGINILFFYLLTFGLAPFYAFTFWLHDKSISFPRAMGYAYLYTLYSYLWFIAGWRAVARILTGRSTWAKTARIPEVPRATSAVPVPVAATERRIQPLIRATDVSALAEGFSAGPDR